MRCQPCCACCSYLYKSNAPGVQDYLCNRLYALPEAGVEKYLSQICQLVISRPFGSLERVLVGLCAKSLRIAVKVCGCHVGCYDTACIIIVQRHDHDCVVPYCSAGSLFIGVLASFCHSSGPAQKQSSWRAARQLRACCIRGIMGKEKQLSNAPKLSLGCCCVAAFAHYLLNHGTLCSSMIAYNIVHMTHCASNSCHHHIWQYKAVVTAAALQR